MPHFIKHCNKTAYQGAPAKTRMWANAQRDGRPTERRRSLFNDAKPVEICRGAQTPEPFSAISGPKLTILSGYIGGIAV